MVGKIVHRLVPRAATTPAETLIRRKAAEVAIWMSRHGQRAVRERAHLHPGSQAQAYWQYGYLTALSQMIDIMHGRIADLSAMSDEGDGSEASKAAS
jgi:hypothetical protein